MNISRNKKWELASVMIEFCLSAFALLSVVAFFWNLWSREEMRENVYGAVLHVLGSGHSFEVYPPAPLTGGPNRAILTPYYNPGFGVFQAWPGPYGQTVALGVSGLTRLPEGIYKTIVEVSTWSKSAANLRCGARLGYFTLATTATVGVAPSSYGTVIGSIDSPFGGAQPIQFYPLTTDANEALLTSRIDEAYNAFKSNGLSPPRKLMGEIQRFDLPTIDAAVREYFGYSAFVAWGCTADNTVMGFFPIRTAVADVFVPQRGL